MTNQYTHALLLLVVLVAASPSVSAQPQTMIPLVITGTIEEAACTPTLSGDGLSGSTLTLQPALQTELDQAGKTTGGQTITFTLVNCSMASTAANNMWVHFSSANVEAGRIVSSNPEVHFEILNDTVSGNQVHAGGTAADEPDANQGTAAPFTGTEPDRGAVKHYVIRYYASQPVTQVGTVSADATYEVKYY